MIHFFVAASLLMIKKLDWSKEQEGASSAIYTIKQFVEVFNAGLVITLIVFVQLLLVLRLYFFIQDEIDAKMICVSGSSTWEDQKHSDKQELEIKKPVVLIRRSPGMSGCEIAWLSP